MKRAWFLFFVINFLVCFGCQSLRDMSVRSNIEGDTDLVSVENQTIIIGEAIVIYTSVGNIHSIQDESTIQSVFNPMDYIEDKKDRDELKKLSVAILTDEENTGAIHSTNSLEFPVKITFEASTVRETLDKINQLKEQPNVAFAMPNRFFSKPDAPNVGSISNKTGSIQSYNPNSMIPGLFNDPYHRMQWYHGLVGAKDLYSQGIRGDGITIAVIDSGINLAHEDLKDAMVSLGPYAVSLSNPFINMNHGTGVAGVIAAQPNNSKGITGIAPGANTIFYADGQNLYTQFISIIFAVHYGKADIISISWGGFCSSDSAAAILFDAAIGYAATQDTLIVSTAGNEGIYLDIFPDYQIYPSAIKRHGNMIVVGGHTDYEKNGHQLEVLTNMFNYGPGFVDVLGPAENIITLDSNGAYANQGGTSLATPITAGSLALLWSQYPEKSASWIKERFLSNQTPILTNYAKYGVLNAYRPIFPD